MSWVSFILLHLIFFLDKDTNTDLNKRGFEHGSPSIKYKHQADPACGFIPIGWK